MRKKLTILLLVILTSIITNLYGTADALTISEIEGNDSFATAQNINGFFSINSSPDVFGTLPTVSIHGSIGATTDVDYYRFSVASTGIGYFDIDGISLHKDNNNKDVVDLEVTLSLFDSGHNLLAADFDSLSYPTDPGSNSTFDSFLGIYKFINPGIYYIAVSSSGNKPLALGDAGAYLARPDCVPSWFNSCDPNNLLNPPAPDNYNGGRLYSNSGPTSVDTMNGDYSSGNYTLHVSVPEPSTALLFGLGIISLLIISRSNSLSPLFKKK